VTASFSFLVITLDLASGRLVLAGRGLNIPRAVLAVEAFGDVKPDSTSVSVIAAALPAWARREFWLGRSAAIYECSPGEVTLSSARMVFSGIVISEPGEVDGILSLSLETPQRQESLLPAASPIDQTRYPAAPAESLGQLPPTIWGDVEAAPLIPVIAQPTTTLAQTAAAGDTSLSVNDATGLPAAGSLWLDGMAYDYTSRADDALYGLTPPALREHRQGTLVALAGDTVYLAAGHAVTAIDQVKADGKLLAATVDLAASTVTLSGPPALSARGERMNLQAHFDQVLPATTAANPANAIRAALGTHTQTAISLPIGITAATDPVAEIVWSRPPDGYRIIGGTYTIGFFVAVGLQVGRTEVSIGGQVVYVYEPGTGPLYIQNPAALQLDDDTDRLPVEVKVAEGGNAEVTISITSATRLVVTGNIDEANYATVAPGKTIQVKQTDVFAERGPIARVQLLARWFATAAGLGVASVKINGAEVGVLKQTQLSDASLTKTITVDVTSQGQASLPQLSVSTSVSGGTAAMSHLSQAQAESLSPSLNVVDTGTGVLLLRGWSQAPVFNGWSAGVDGAMTVELVFTGKTPFLNEGVDYVKATVKDAGGATLLTLAASSTSSATAIATNTWKVAGVISSGTPAAVEFEEFSFNGATALSSPNRIKISSMSMRWNARITSNAVSLANTPASGSSSPISSRNLSHAGTAVAVNNGNISFSVPAPPRVVDTFIPLSVRQWADLTDLTADVSLVGGAPSVALVEVSLLVEYDAQIYEAAAGPVTARIISGYANPADIIADLAAATGSVLDVGSKRRFADWCDANNYRFARRLADATDALQLLTYAIDQANVQLCEGSEGGRLVRWFDVSGRPIRIHDEDLMAPAEIAWDERIENAITLKYRQDYAGDGFKAALVADPDNNAWCRRSMRECGQRRPITVEAGWIRDDATAALFLADYARRYAPMRRVVSLELPFTYAPIRRGSLLLWRRMWLRVLETASDNGWISLTAGEIL